jgi:hypothetical protein
MWSTFLNFFHDFAKVTLQNPTCAIQVGIKKLKCSANMTLRHVIFRIALWKFSKLYLKFLFQFYLF